MIEAVIQEIVTRGGLIGAIMVAMGFYVWRKDRDALKSQADALKAQEARVDDAKMVVDKLLTIAESNNLTKATLVKGIDDNTDATRAQAKAIEANTQAIREKLEIRTG